MKSFSIMPELCSKLAYTIIIYTCIIDYNICTMLWHAYSNYALLWLGRQLCASVELVHGCTLQYI